LLDKSAKKEGCNGSREGNRKQSIEVPLADGSSTDLKKRVGGGPRLAWVEANAHYNLLEQKVIPKFYTWDKGGIPSAWVKRMRESVAHLTPRFSADRAVREYTQQRYVPAVAAYRLRAVNKGEIGKRMIDWRHGLDKKWASLHFGDVKVETRDEQHAFEVQVYLNDLDAKTVRVELYANGVEGNPPVRQENEDRSAACRHIGWLRLSRGCVCNPAPGGLYGAIDTTV
jgi:hypothetical protein